MKIKRFFLRIVLVVCFATTALGCAAGEGPAGGQAVIPSELPSATPPPTLDRPATQAAQETASSLATSESQATSTAESLAATALGKTQAAENVAATSTQAAGFKLTATADFFALSTSQARGMEAEVQKLYDAGTIGTLEGEYHRLDDFDESWAQLNYYQWWPTGYSAENFVMQADAFVSSASDNANWFDSACGVIFTMSDTDNHDIVWIAMDGRAYLMSIHKGNRQLLEIDRWGPATKTEFEVHFVMAVNDKKMTLYIGDQEVLSAYDGLIVPGLILNTLVSGTNKGYGTRCKLTNVDLWIIK